MTVPVSVWLTGQYDNIGDSALRRAYAQALRGVGPLDAWVGDVRSGYAAGLGLRPGEARRGFVPWYLRFAGRAITGRGVFAFNAGEFVPTRAYFAGVVALLPFIALLKARGGRVLWLGAGVQATMPGFTWPFTALARLSDPLEWRDAESVRLMGGGGTMPDWAFGLGSGGTADGEPAATGGGDRDRIAIACRGDREFPSDRWIESVRRLAQRFGLEPVVVVQVARDEATARRLGAVLDAEVVGWGDGDHAEQERRVRTVYRRSRLVVSDRLHALIIAATEGAVPIGWAEHQSGKLARHFDLVGGDWVSARGADPASRLDRLDADGLGVLEARTAEVVAAARAGVLGSRISGREAVRS